MSRILWFTARLVWLVVRIVALATSIYVFFLRPWEQSWRATPEEAAKTLPGDDVVPDATVCDTRAITIDAPPSAIWPWLVQIGFGRAGWYSYDRIDMRGVSADSINQEWQHLEIGDIVPTDPEGGFRVAALEPEHSLVLFADTELRRAQTEAAARRRADRAEAAETPVNLKAVGVVGAATFPEFAGSWAFYLDPIDERRTRLIERFRVRMAEQPMSRVTGPAIGFGIFLMTHKQMLGLKERAERSAATGPAPATKPMPA